MAKGNKVTIIGLDDLDKGLDKSEKQIMTATRDTVEESLKLVRDSAKDNAPVDSGKMRDGIGMEVDDDGLNGTVGQFDPDVYYSEFVEFGTSKQPAQPFMAPAAEDARQKIPGMFRSNIGKAVES